jgi:hypothetical protein
MVFKPVNRFPMIYNVAILVKFRLIIFSKCCFVLLFSSLSITSYSYGQNHLCDSIIIENTTAYLPKSSIVFLETDSLIFNNDFHNYSIKNVKKELYGNKKCFFRKVYVLETYSSIVSVDSLKKIDVVCNLFKRIRDSVLLDCGVFRYSVYFDNQNLLKKIEMYGGVRTIELYPDMKQIADRKKHKMSYVRKLMRESRKSR